MFPDWRKKKNDADEDDTAQTQRKQAAQTQRRDPLKDLPQNLAKASGDALNAAKTAAQNLPDAISDNAKIISESFNNSGGREYVGKFIEHVKNQKEKYGKMKIKDIIEAQYRTAKEAGKETIEKWKKEFGTDAKKEDE